MLDVHQLTKLSSLADVLQGTRESNFMIITLSRWLVVDRLSAKIENKNSFSFSVVADTPTATHARSHCNHL